MANFATYDDIESIVNEQFAALESKTINDIYEEMKATDDVNKIYIIKSPIYYLFDGYINDKIGSQNLKRNTINSRFKINDYFLQDPRYSNYSRKN